MCRMALLIVVTSSDSSSTGSSNPSSTNNPKDSRTLWSIYTGLLYDSLNGSIGFLGMYRENDLPTQAFLTPDMLRNLEWKVLNTLRNILQVRRRSVDKGNREPSLSKDLSYRISHSMSSFGLKSLHLFCKEITISIWYWCKSI